jgi:hypothetical protein
MRALALPRRPLSLYLIQRADSRGDYDCAVVCCESADAARRLNYWTGLPTDLRAALDAMADPAAIEVQHLGIAAPRVPRGIVRLACPARLQLQLQAPHQALSIYLVERTDPLGFWEYDHIVVCCESADAARQSQPEAHGRGWTADPSTLDVQLLGTAVPRLCRGIICALYVAG